MTTDGPVLLMEGVRKVFGSGVTEVVAVAGVNLDVATGEVVLVMGPSGSGKTTLLTMAGGLLRPSAGSIAIEGQELTRLSDQALSRLRRERIGFVFQTFNLLAALTALENVLVPMTLAGRRQRADRDRAEGLLVGFGLGARLHFRPDQLSGGEKQRVSLARALANDPSLILADEPTANLDSQRGHEIMELLRAVAKEQGKAVVIVSHDQRIQDIADRVLWLEDGRFKAMDLVRDPVCGMTLDPRLAPLSLGHRGRALYFCAEGCRQLFLASPERFLAAPGLFARADQPPSL